MNIDIEEDSLWKEGFLSGDQNRIFINSALGCSANCSYCYLPRIGYNNGLSPQKLISAQKLVYALQKSNKFIPGKKGSILSLGCFSECWDKINIEETKKILNFAINQGDPIQLSTKKCVCMEDFIDVNISEMKWLGQTTVFVSSATISHWNKMEKGTTYPYKRFKTFETFNQINIPAYLYIKPVINGITLLDSHLYGQIMDLYKINAVVGSSFNTQYSNNIAPICTDKLFYDYSPDEEYIRSMLKNFGKIYRFSIEPINELR